MADVPAASSPAPEVVPTTPTEVLASLSETERLEWRKSGDLPKDKIPVSSAASPPAEPDDQAVSTEPTTAAASEPAKPKKNADTRIQELLADRARLERELADARRPASDVRPAAPSPAPAVETFPEYAEYLTQHPDASLEKWMDARDDWRDARKDAKAAEQSEAQALTRSQEARAQRFNAQIQESAKADPEFLSKISPDVLAIRPIAALKPGEAAGPVNIVGAELLNSPVAPQLMRHWSEHPDDLQRLVTVPATLAHLPPVERAREHTRWMIREIGKLEAKFEPAGEPASPPTKTVSDAPDPGTTLGSRPAAPADAVEAAIRRKDPGAYIREANARELAALKR